SEWVRADAIIGNPPFLGGKQLRLNLGGIPGVVYGYFAFLFLTPLLAETIFPSISAFNALSGGICVGLFILPIITSLTEDAFQSIPLEMRNSGYALALTKQEVIRLILLPIAFPRILGAIALAASIALGETMIVAIASGQKPNLTLNPLESIETITSFILRVSLGGIEFDSLIFKTIFTLGFILFIVTLTLNTLNYWLQHRQDKTIYIENTKQLFSGLVDNSINQNNYNYLPLSHENNQIAENLTTSPLRIWLDKILGIIGFLSAIVGVLFIILLFWQVGSRGFSNLNWTFFSSFTSRKPEESGILAALGGSLWLFILTLVMVVPLGVGSAIYLEEYRRDNVFNRLLEVSIANLAAIPSILYGLLGLEIFVRVMKPITGGYSILSGALVLTLITLPTMIVTSRSALKNAGKVLREGGYAVGMTKEQVLQKIIIPSALPSIITGILLSQIRALAETAALIGVGASASVRFLPSLNWDGLTSSYTTLPVQIFYWLQSPKEEVQSLAAAAIIVLVVILLVLSLIALWIREFFDVRSV
ncbi:MAG: phosphate ABC transporter permease PstA, partial [Cyanobacteria bacterium J149]